MDSGMPRAHAPNEENVSRDIEQVDHQVTVAVLRELAGIRTEVPSNRGFPANKMDELLKRVRVLAQAIVEAPDSANMPRLPRVIENIRHSFSASGHLAIASSRVRIASCAVSIRVP
jgi:hypothetical protein